MNSLSEGQKEVTSRRIRRNRPRSPILAAVGWLVAVGSALAVVAGLLSWFVPGASLPTRIVLGVLAATAISFVVLNFRYKLRHAVAIGMTVVAVVTIAVLQRPSETERDVAGLIEEVAEANIWVDRNPVIFEEAAVPYIVAHFDAFDYRTWHSWEELPFGDAAPLRDLVIQSAGYAGKGVVTLGQVNAAQPMGGQDWLLQIIPLSLETASRSETRSAIEELVGESYASELLADAVVDPHDSLRILYCRVTLAPMSILQAGETVLINGTSVAYGRTERGDARLAHVNYFLGSSVARLYDYAPQE